MTAGELQFVNGAVINMTGSARLVNSETVNFVGNGGIQGEGAIRNSGLFEKTAGINGDGSTHIYVPFDNKGTVESSSYPLIFNEGNSAGESDTGNYTTNGGAVALYGARTFEELVK